MTAAIAGPVLASTLSTILQGSAAIVAQTAAETAGSVIENTFTAIGTQAEIAGDREELRATVESQFAAVNAAVDVYQKAIIAMQNSQTDFKRHCQPLADAGTLKEPVLVIPFATTIETAKNFFGRNLQGGDHAYSSADYATKIAKVGVTLVGYDALASRTTDGLAADPNVYLVPVGNDYLRAPTTSRQILCYSVVDQVLPLPYAIGTTELDDEDYISTFSGLDGTSDSAAKIRRHSTLFADGTTYSTRLCGRSVWNDKWLLVIPAVSLNASRAQGLETFIRGVSDIKLGIQAYSRSGN